jgi:hypothetical protein
MQIKKSQDSRLETGYVEKGGFEKLEMRRY